MNDLPADLADVLHLLEPSSDRSPWIGWLVATALVAALLWMLWRRRRRRPAEPPAAAPPPPPPKPLSGIEKIVARIRAHYADDGDIRKGCHELSEVLRSHFETSTGKPVSTLTVGEMAAVIGDSAVTRFFSLLTDLQFRRRSPTRDDLEGACDLAIDVFVQPGNK